MYALVSAIHEGFKEAQHLETDVVFPSRTAIIAVPIASDPLPCQGEKFWIQS